MYFECAENRDFSHVFWLYNCSHFVCTYNEVAQSIKRKFLAKLGSVNIEFVSCGNPAVTIQLLAETHHCDLHLHCSGNHLKIKRSYFCNTKISTILRKNSLIFSRLKKMEFIFLNSLNCLEFLVRWNYCICILFNFLAPSFKIS